MIGEQMIVSQLAYEPTYEQYVLRRKPRCESCRHHEATHIVWPGVDPLEMSVPPFAVCGGCVLPERPSA